MGRAERIEDAARALLEQVGRYEHDPEDASVVNALRAALALPADAPEGAVEAGDWDDNGNCRAHGSPVCESCAFDRGYAAGLCKNPEAHAHPAPRAEAASVVPAGMECGCCGAKAGRLHSETGCCSRHQDGPRLFSATASAPPAAPASAEAVARDAARNVCRQIAGNPVLLTSDVVDPIVDRAVAHALRAGGSINARIAQPERP